MPVPSLRCGLIASKIDPRASSPHLVDTIMTRTLLALFVAALFAMMMPGRAVAAEGRVTPLTEYPKGAEVVTVGFYPINVYAVDPSSSTFMYDGYIWMRWNGDIDPTETMELVNAVDKSSISKEFLFDEPQIMPNGSKYQIMRVESQLYKPFSLSNFPLDSHHLSVIIEDSLSGINQLVYKIDKDDTKFGPSLAIAGWKLTGWDSESFVNDYASNFGDVGSDVQASKFAQLSFNLNITRPESYFIWKLLLPLVVVLCGAWIALLLNPVLTETRAALPASALLTTVFLQQSYNGALPETGGLVLLDKIYVAAYILIVVTLARVIIKSRDVEQMTEDEVRVLRSHDARALCIQVAIFVASTLFIIFTR